MQSLDITCYNNIYIIAVCFKAVLILMLSLTRTLMGPLRSSKYFSSCCQEEHFSAKSSVCGGDYQITEWNELVITLMSCGQRKKVPKKILDMMTSLHGPLWPLNAPLQSGLSGPLWGEPSAHTRFALTKGQECIVLRLNKVLDDLILMICGTMTLTLCHQNVSTEMSYEISSAFND